MDKFVVVCQGYSMSAHGPYTFEQAQLIRRGIYGARVVKLTEPRRKDA